jgi:hypothetical protein
MAMKPSPQKPSLPAKNKPASQNIAKKQPVSPKAKKMK